MNDNILQLIYRHLEGSISDKEKILLNKWRNESFDNDNAYHAIELAWDTTATLKTDIQVNLDDEYSVLSEKLEIKSKKRVASNIRWITPLSVAAGLALLLGFIFLTPRTLQSDKGTWIEVVTSDQLKTIELADQSIVHINRNSALRYPSKFEEFRHLTMVRGEAHFDVEHNPDKEFIVETQNSRIKVLGTSFVVKDDGLVVNLTVTSGKVHFKSKISEHELVMNKGEHVTLRNGTVHKNVLTTNDIAWHTGIFNFEQTQISDVISSLESHHQSPIQVQEKSLLNCTVSVRFDNESLSSSLNTLSIILSADVKQNPDGTYVIVGGRCQ